MPRAETSVMNESPYQVAPGAHVIPSFYGDDGAPFLVIVNRLVVNARPVAPGPGCDLYLPDLRLYWSEEGFVTPVRHPVVDADDLDEAYWQGVLALWDRCATANVRATHPEVVVPGGVVLRGRRLQQALDPRRAEGCDGRAPAVASSDEVESALASVRRVGPHHRKSHRSATSPRARPVTRDVEDPPGGRRGHPRPRQG